MSEKVGELLDEVKDRETFLSFGAALVEDRKEATELERENPVYWQFGGANGWQNSSIEAFLDAAAACCDSPANREEMDDLADKNAWKFCAEFLFGGKIYE